MSEIKKVINQDKTVLLIRDGQPLSCPFQPALPIQGKLAGQISFVKQPCSSNCPFFDDYPDGNLSRVILKCKDVAIIYTTDKEEESIIKLL
jgi:hypothetical protein